MPHTTQCPSCKCKIEYVSSRIGVKFTCSMCGYSFELPVPEEVNHPQVYNLPAEIEIRVCNEAGLPIRMENILISIDRGYIAGPFFTDKQGTVRITKKVFEEAEKDWISSGGGDHRNFSLIGTLDISTPSEEIIDRWVKARESVWNFLSEYEKKNWQSVGELIHAMKSSSNNKIKPATLLIGLEGIVGTEKMLCEIKTQVKSDSGEN